MSKGDPGVDLGIFDYVNETTKEGGLSGAAKGAAIGAAAPAAFNVGVVISCATLGISAASFTFALPAVVGLSAAGAVYGLFKKK